jgi:hypothetical protein
MRVMSTNRFKHFLFVLFGVAVLSVTGVGISTQSPSAEAATQCMTISNLTYGLNNSSYTIRAKWSVDSKPSGCTFDHWRVKYQLTSGGTITNHTYGSNDRRSVDLSGFKCGVNYYFWVVAENANNGNVSNEPRKTTKTACPAISTFNFTASGQNVTASWSSTSAPVASTVEVYINNVKEYSGGSSGTFTVKKSYSTTYSAFVKPKAGTQYGSPSVTKTATTGPAPSTGGSTGGTSGGTTSGGTSTKKSTSSGGTASAPLPVKPNVPADFVASVQSSKIIQLNWSAVTNAGEVTYQIDRSTDNQNWTLLATTGDTSYKDEATDFSTTYYYRLKALNATGDGSDYTTAQATTEAFKASGNSITSDDKAATVTIPEGAFSQSVDCSFDSNAAANTPALPKDKLLLRGPYGLLCVGEDGFTVTQFEKPLKVVLKLPNGKYDNFDVRQSDGEEWKGAKANYDAKKRELSFELTAVNFAAFGEKQKSLVGTIFTVLMWLLLLTGGALGIRWFIARRNSGGGQPLYAMADAGGIATSDVAEQQFEAAALKPGCTHLNMAHQVQPQTTGCAECTAEGKHWKALRICLTCGHVGCSDDSDEQHARKHFESTGHPLIYEYGNPNGDTIGWCYIDQTYI